MADHTAPVLDLSHAPPDVISMVLCSMPLRYRCNCALVCNAWAEVATAATRSIILEHRMQDLSGLQIWLEKYGSRLEVLQLHDCHQAVLNTLPCAELQDLLLNGVCARDVSIASKAWADIASATKLTSVLLSGVQTASQQADVVSALTALPNLEQLTWCYVWCSTEWRLADSSLLQQMTQLTSLGLHVITAAALQHLGSLTKLQHLSISAERDWPAAGCPELQELSALTSLDLSGCWEPADLPASVSQLTALRQLNVPAATPTELNGLHILTKLTHLGVWQVMDLSPESPPLQLPGLQRLELYDEECATMPMSFLASCTQLQFLKLQGYELKGPCSLPASTMLQHLELRGSSLAAADAAADPASWQQVFPGPGQLPHLTYLELWTEEPALEPADFDHLVECCSNLRVLHLDTPVGDFAHAQMFAPALARLPGLTDLQVNEANTEDYGMLAQLTGLRQLIVGQASGLSVQGLRQLAALNQLTSLGFGEFYCSNLDSLAGHLMKDSLPDCQYAIINKAPSGTPPDVSQRLLDICDVVDAFEGRLSIEAVTEAAYRLLHRGSPGPSAGEGLMSPTGGTVGSCFSPESLRHILTTNTA